MPVLHLRRGLASGVATLAVTTSMVGLLINATAPVASAQTIAPVTIQSATPTGPTVVVTGSATDGALIGLYDDTGLIGGATADPVSGAWTTYVNLLPGTYNLYATETVSGIQSGTSATVPVSIGSDQLVDNGSFDAPVVDAPQLPNYPPNNGVTDNWENYTSIPGWVPTNSCGIELQTETTLSITLDNGNPQYLELESNCPSGIVQTLQTVPGTQYVVSFDYQGRQDASTAENTISAEWGGTSLASRLVGGANWVTQTYTVMATSPTSVLEFDSTDTLPGDSSGGLLDNVSVVPAASQQPTNTSWPTAATVTPTVSSPAQSAGTIAFPGEDLWYDFPIVPGEQVQVSLSNVPADYDIALFSDISQTFQSETSSALNLAALGAEAPGNAAAPSTFTPSTFTPSTFTPSTFTPSTFTPSTFTPSIFTPSTFTPSTFTPSTFTPSTFTPSTFTPSTFTAAYSDAQIDSLLAVSSAPGAVNKSVIADTWNNTGNFYIRISGNNGADSPNPYTLSVTTSGGPCASAQGQPIPLSTFSGSSTISAPAGSSPRTVIVDNSQLMPAAAVGGSLYAPLQKLATATNGVVVDVSQSAQVNQLVGQAQAYPGCPFAENLEAQAIQNIINSYRSGASGNLQYVVIVGDDDVIPFFRYPDNAGLASESNYEPPLLSTSAADAALANDYYVSDDQYGAATELSIQGTTVPLPSAAVGRLVETPADILQTIDAYLPTSLGGQGDQVITPKSSLATGYDFIQPPATQIANSFASGDPKGTNRTLITNDGVAPSTTGEPPGPGFSWSASDLASALFGSHHDLVFLGGHFSANNLLAADYATTMTTNQFAAQVGSTLEDSLVLSVGCHSGYNIDGADGVPGVTDDLAWPQAFSEAGATLIAGTGYQYGDTNYVAYSDQVDVDIAQQLDYGPGRVGGPASVPVNVGTALLAAKQQYLASLDQLNGMEEKALQEITLYGLPMVGVAEPNQVSTPGGPTSAVTASTVSTNPGATLGLEQADLNVGPSLSLNTVQPVGSSSSYTYYSGPQGVVADPGGPVLPVQTEDVNVAGQTLRGVGLWGGTYTSTPGTNPLTGDPATETGNPNLSPFASPVLFPQTIWNPNYFSTLLSGGVNTELALTPVQYMSDPGSTTTDTRLTYSDMDLHLFYSDNTSTYGGNTPALAAPPTISGVTSTTNGPEVNVSATVAGAPSAGIQEVWVTYTNPGSPNPNSWSSMDLTQSATNSTLWTGSFSDPSGLSGIPSKDAIFMVQAVNGVGEVSMNNNDGYYFTPSFTPGAPPAVGSNAYTLNVGGAAGGQYHGNATVSGTLVPTGTGTTAALAGQSITFSLGATAVAGTLNSSGVATAVVPLIEPPGTYTLSGSYSRRCQRPAGDRPGDTCRRPGADGPGPIRARHGADHLGRQQWPNCHSNHGRRAFAAETGVLRSVDARQRPDTRDGRRHRNRHHQRQWRRSGWPDHRSTRRHRGGLQRHGLLRSKQRAGTRRHDRRDLQRF